MKQKIAVIHPDMTRYGGAELVVHELCNALVVKGHKVVLYCRKFDSSFWMKKELDYEVAEVNPGAIYKVFRDFKFFAKKISKELENFDLIITHNFPSYIYLYYAKKFNKKINGKSVWYCHSVAQRLYPKIAHAYFYRYKNKKILPCILNRIKFFFNSLFNYTLKNIDQKSVKQIDLILANSVYMSGIIKSIYGVYSKTCYPGIINKPQKEQVAYEKYFLMLSWFGHSKNIENVIKAVSAIKNFGGLHGFTFVLCGAGILFKKVKKLIKKLNLEENVDLRNYVTADEKNDLIKNCSFCVYPVFDEGFGLFVVESFLNKKCVITSNHGGPNELVENGKTGYLVAPESVDEIKNAIETLIENPQETKKMGGNAYNFIKHGFSFNDFFERFYYEIQG